MKNEKLVKATFMGWASHVTFAGLLLSRHVCSILNILTSTVPGIFEFNGSSLAKVRKSVCFVCTKCYLGCVVVRHLSIGVNPVNP